jgi:hypothetical protein
MALVPCRECKRDISTEAVACPHCGAVRPTAKPDKSLEKGCGYGCLGIVVIAIIGSLATSSSPSPSATLGGGANPTIPSAPAVPPRPDSVIAAERWTVNRSESEMDGSELVTISVPAERPISTWLSSKLPLIIIRCKERKLEVLALTGSAAHVELYHSDEARVRVRLDEGTPTTQWWNESTDDEAIFAPNPQRLARAMGKAKQLRLEFTPFNASPQVMEFDLGGLRSHLPAVFRTCKVSP